MAGGMAHDVNQTLTLIAGHAELGLHALGDEPIDLARAREALEAIGRAAVVGADVTRRLLVSGHDEAVARLDLVDLTELMREVARFTSPRWRTGAAAEGRTIRLVIEAEAGPPDASAQSGAGDTAARLGRLAGRGSTAGPRGRRRAHRCRHPGAVDRRRGPARRGRRVGRRGAAAIGARAVRRGDHRPAA